MTASQLPQDVVLVPITRILRQPGTRHPLARELYLDGLVVGDTAVVTGTPVSLDVVLEAIGDAVTVTGTVSAVARCECRRCTEEFELPLVVELQEIFEPRPTEGETYPLAGESIDVVPLARDAVLLALPLAPLCRLDCAGPAPDAFPTGPAVAEVDPRWAALRDLQIDT